MVPILQSPDSPMHMTSSQGSYLVAIVLAGSFCSPLPIAWSMDRYLGDTIQTIRTYQQISHIFSNIGSAGS